MSSKITNILEEINKLSVLELVDLVKKIEDEYGVSAAAPVAVAAPSAAAAEGSAAEAEKTEFKVILKDIGSEKIKVIKALRSVTSLAIKEAKDAAESAPYVVSESAPKDEAQKIKEALEAAGAKVELS
jgi:large subunit ribosomal protein L7/L12